MQAIRGYQIPIVGMSDGKRSYTYVVDAAFFEHFENEELKAGRFEVRLDLDRLGDTLILHFDIKGSMDTTCDRCMADIILPIEDQHKLYIKLAEGESSDPDVEHIAPDTQQLDVSKPLYEHVLMSMPMTNVYDCTAEDPIPCDEAALDTLEEAAEKKDSGIWDALKNIELDS